MKEGNQQGHALNAYWSQLKSSESSGMMESQYGMRGWKVIYQRQRRRTHFRRVLQCQRIGKGEKKEGHLQTTIHDLCLSFRSVLSSSHPAPHRFSIISIFSSRKNFPAQGSSFELCNSGKTNFILSSIPDHLQRAKENTKRTSATMANSKVA